MCMGCGHQDETLRHVLKCRHRMAETKRNDLLKMWRKKGRSKKIPGKVLEVMKSLLEGEMRRAGGKHDKTWDTQAKEAVRQQEAIGIHMMARGYLAKGWRDWMKEMGVKKVERCMDQMQRMVWMEWVLPLWTVRNEI